MPGASGLSKREELEQLMAELRRLSPDARGPEFKKWRARANATMSDLFGPGHKLTMAFRDVTFTPDFGQGRARALALLSSASGFATASSESKAAPARPIAAAVPNCHDATAELPQTPEPVMTPGPVTIAESAVPELPDGLGATAVVPETDTTAELPETDVTAVMSTTAEDDASAQPPGTTDQDAIAQPMPDTVAGLAPDAIEPKHGTILRRIVRKHDSFGTHPALPDEPTGTVGEALEGSPVQTPDTVLSEPATAELGPVSSAEPAPISVAGLFGTAEPAQPEPAYAGPTEATASPTADMPARPAPGVSASALRPAEPPTAAEPRWPRRETIVQESDTSWTPRRTAGKSDTPRKSRTAVEESEAPWTARTTAGEPDTPWTAPVIPHGPTRTPPEASRRPKRKHKRFAIAAIIIIFLELAVGVPVWLGWFGSWSTALGSGSTTVTNSATSLPNPGSISPSANARIVDATGDPRSAYIIGVVRAGIVQLTPSAAGEVSFLPKKVVGRGEFLAWLDRVRQIPTGSREVPDTFFYDLGPPLRFIAIDAYQQRIVLEWPSEDTKIAFNAADPILARDAEAWAARMIIALLPVTALQSALEITEARVLDLRARISSLKPQELATIMEGLKLRPEAGWAKKASISRSEAAELLMRLKAVFDKYPAA